MKDKGLKFGFIGLGQAGGNIANEFAAIGYKTLALNTSKTDLDYLNNIGDNYKMLINVGVQGAGKNPDVGRDALEQKINEVYENVMTIFPDCDKIFVCAGMGGGTGSGMMPLMVEILAEQGMDVGVITTLPSEVESSRVKLVALSTFEHLTEIEGVNSIFIIDNKKASDRLPGVGINSKYKMLNEKVATQMDYVNNLCVMPSLLAFDAKDLETVLRTRGLAIMNQVTIENVDTLKDELTLSTVLKEALETSVGPHLERVESGAAVFLFELPKGKGRYLTEKSMKIINERVGSPFDVFYGVYEEESKDEDKNMGTLTMLLTGLSVQDIPRLNELNEDIVSKEDDIERLFDKQKQSFSGGKATGLLNRVSGKKEPVKPVSKTGNGNSVLDRIRSRK